MPSDPVAWANGRIKTAKLRQSAFAFLGDVPGTADAFPFMEVDAEAVRDTIAVWAGRGYAIGFGLTSDGGAMGVHLHANGEKKSSYFGSVSELEDFLSRVRASGGVEPGK